MVRGQGSVKKRKDVSVKSTPPGTRTRTPPIYAFPVLGALPSECPAHGLLSEALTGDLNLLKKSIADLDDGVGLAKTIEDVQDCQDRTALHYAASEGRAYICKYLVQGLKLDVNMKDGEGETPFELCNSEEEEPNCVFSPWEWGKSELANDKGFSALHYAAHKAFFQMKRVVKLGALIAKSLCAAVCLHKVAYLDVSIPIDQLTIMYCLYFSGLKELMRLLILKGAAIDVKSDAGTPLHYAAAQGKKDSVKILLDKKANSLLGFAASQGEAEVMKCLLKAGANPNVTNCIGLTPLEIAVLHGNHEKVKILLPLTSPLPTIPDWSFHGIVRHAYSEKRQETGGDDDLDAWEQKKNKSFLLSKSKGEAAFKEKEYIDAIYWQSMPLSNKSLCWAHLNEGIPALSDAEACVMKRPDWVKAYYREGVTWRLLKNFHMAAYAFLEALKLDPENKELETALRSSVGSWKRNSTFGEGLAKTFVDVKDLEGRSAVHFAAVGGKTHICKYWVQELKLDVNMQNGKGETPLNHADIGENHQTAVFLVENGANLNVANDKGFTALHYAAEKGLNGLLRLLISRGVEVDAKSDAGRPLQCAVAKGKIET
ncbi:hypothetical protein Acr_23g0019540 [Actinidia rufa]|uniref:Ankyrin repeat family protein n=1 Tax=Actinidia rufa TaxID=165716 RepID=A0A7J0GS07_9ERIC|nr:hypothetical protein Acr_23g0019540 [Actinidia rufa]